MKYTPLILAVFSPPCLAGTAAGVPTPAGSIAQMMLGLGIVLALLYATLMVLRRLQGGQNKAVGALKVLTAVSVGARERVVLVSVGKQVLVLGVAPGRVSTLHTLTEADLPLAPESTQTAAPAADFASRLKQMMERGRHGR